MFLARESTDDDGALFERLEDQEYGGRVERVILFQVDAWDVNCPKHIKPRFTEKEIGDTVSALQRRIKELESQIRASSDGRMNKPGNDVST